MKNKPDRGIQKKQDESYLDSVAKNLILALKVLKNCEEVEEENLKFNSYSRLLKNSIYFAIFYKIYISILITKRLIPEKDKDEQLEILHFLPCYHLGLIASNMGTQKLAPTIARKIDEDNRNGKVSEFERFISVFLYSDIRGKNYFERLSEFISKANKKYILDMSFAKIMGYYTYRSKDADADLKYLNMVGDILIKAKGYSKETKSTLMDKYKNKKHSE